MGFNTSLGLAGSYSLSPMPSLTVSDQNYIDFTSSTTAGWAQQYLPELYEQEIERYGNRSISGFLQMVGAEMPMSSDQVIWSEQNRLHIAYKSSGAADGADSIQLIGTSGTCSLGTNLTNSLRVGNTVIITDTATGLKTLKCYVSQTSGTATGGNNTNFTVLPYTQTDLTGCYGTAVIFSDNEQINVFVYGSEFAKGSASMVGELKPQFQHITTDQLLLKITLRFLVLILLKLVGLKLLMKVVLQDILGT